MYGWLAVSLLPKLTQGRAVHFSLREQRERCGSVTSREEVHNFSRKEIDAVLYIQCREALRSLIRTLARKTMVYVRRQVLLYKKGC